MLDCGSSECFKLASAVFLIAQFAFPLLGYLGFTVDFTDREHYKKSNFFIIFF